MTHASLFSGIGGGELAASWLGWRNLFHCEINPFGRKVLNYWFPNSQCYEDITRTDFTPWRGRVDVLTGGFPCQPFSCAGQRRGAEDDSYLWPQMLRAIREIRPTWVVGENVAGILTMVQPGSETEMGGSASLFDESLLYRAEQEFVVETVCRDLEREGYSVQPLVIPACAVGAPHRRDRVWFIAYRSDGRHGSASQGKRSAIPARVGIGASCAERPIANSDGERCHDGSDNRQERYVHHDEERDAAQGEPQRDQRQCGIGADGEAAPDAEIGRCMSRRRSADGRQERPQERNGILGDALGYGQERIAPDSESARGEWQREQGPREIQSYGRDCEEIQAIWRNFPTQSPVCRGDDGISLGLAGISFPAWRREAVKALGNAWCVPVAYEIFRAINGVDYGHKDN